MPDYSWFQVATGLTLPSDYLAWAEAYPSLEICHELLVTNLIAGTGLVDIPDHRASTVSRIAADRQHSPMRRTVYDDAGTDIGAQPWPPIYPEPGGLLPWGVDTKGGIYLWNTEAADSNLWTVVVYDGAWREFDAGFLAFLIRLLHGDFVGSRIFLRGWPWIPAIREFYEGGVLGEPGWRTPAQWSAYFDAYSARRRSNADGADKSWVDQFKVTELTIEPQHPCAEQQGLLRFTSEEPYAVAAQGIMHTPRVRAALSSRSKDTMTTNHAAEADAPSWPRAIRLSARWTITEKILGTSGVIVSTPAASDAASIPGARIATGPAGQPLVIRAASRTRWLVPVHHPRAASERDNFDFAAWVYDNAPNLALLGPGEHRGEWYGAGIGHGYGLARRQFALLDTDRWSPKKLPAGVPETLMLVPMLAECRGDALNATITACLLRLAKDGSSVVPGAVAEGIVARSRGDGRLVITASIADLPIAIRSG